MTEPVVTTTSEVRQRSCVAVGHLVPCEACEGMGFVAWFVKGLYCFTTCSECGGRKRTVTFEAWESERVN